MSYQIIFQHGVKWNCVVEGLAFEETNGDTVEKYLKWHSDVFQECIRKILISIPLLVIYIYLPLTLILTALFLCADGIFLMVPARMCSESCAHLTKLKIDKIGIWNSDGEQHRHSYKTCKVSA